MNTATIAVITNVTLSAIIAYFAWKKADQSPIFFFLISAFMTPIFGAICLLIAILKYKNDRAKERSAATAPATLRKA